MERAWTSSSTSSAHLQKWKPARFEHLQTLFVGEHLRHRPLWRAQYLPAPNAYSSRTSLSSIGILPSSMKRLRVLVCGTNYGRIYRAAIQQAPRAFELVGILARGSVRSLELSRELGVPLYREVESLPGDIDIACAAMGTSGEGVVLRLLEHGIHVLCEHPHGPHFMETAKRIAAQHHVCFHVNGHFAGLQAASAFIKHCNLMRRFAAPVFLDAMGTDRSLYGVLDILQSASISFEPFEFLARDHSPPFTLIKASAGGVPATLQLQDSGTEGRMALKDGDPRYIVDYRLAVGFPHGVLNMLSIVGPVIWNNNLFRSSKKNRRLWTFIDRRPGSSFDLYRQRVKANLMAVRCLVRSARGQFEPPEQNPEHIFAVSRAWAEIIALIHRPTHGGQQQ
jgi:thiazolinyl imide reductase